jgi:hexokinase
MEVYNMSNLLTKLHKLASELSISPHQILAIADSFQQAMRNGLSGSPSSLKMLPSYLNKPSRKEIGTFLALDFGGTNVRVLLTELLGKGQFTVHARAGKPLTNAAEQYNHISRSSTANQLFDFIAKQIATLVKPDIIYPLGHTFSFPINQTGLNTGTLIHWTKEIETTGVEGEEITTLLRAALIRQNLDNVLPQAIINDTVGTLLASAYANQYTDIGSICGTGHNTAYIEPRAPWTKQPMIINMESGNFDELPFTSYDTLLDMHSEKPGVQRLEKMVSGHYVGELVRIIACSLFADGLLANCSKKEILNTPYILNGAHISLLLEDDSAEYENIAYFLENKLEISGSTSVDRQVLKDIAALVSTRSARLVAATYIGIIHHIDPNLTQNHNIAIDGSLYEKVPGYAATIQLTLDQAFSTTEREITTTLTKDGSGIGAAIATAIAVHKDN